MFNFIFLQITNPGTLAGDSVQKAITQAADVAASGLPKETSISLLELLMKGGIIMMPIAVLLLLSVFVILERIISISKASKREKNFMSNIKDFVKTGNIEAAKSLCKNTFTPSARMIEKGILRIGKPIDEIEGVMENIGKLEIYKLERNLGILSIIGRIAPMLGFIGTIMGVIKIFYDIALANTISIDVIAGGLYQKMITSASGLVVGVIAFIGYHWINIIINKIINRMEIDAVEFIDLLHEPSI